MRLFYTQGSPYARKARVVLREVGLLGRVEETTVVLRSPGNELLNHGPTGKVPALQTDDGRFLIESTIICHYLDEQHDGPKLHPTDPEARWAALEIDGLGIALQDSLSWRARELRRPKGEQSPSLIAYEAERAARCYDALEALVDRLHGPLHIGQITIAVALGYADYRLPEEGWRDRRAGLAAWYEEFAERPSMSLTQPPAA